MKLTLDIPDELYRRVKARSAMEGRPVRAVAVDLFRKWLEEKPEQGQTLVTFEKAAKKLPATFVLNV